MNSDNLPGLLPDRAGRTEIHYAAAKGDADQVSKLIAAGHDIHLADPNNWTPLHFAAQSQSAATINALIAAGAEVNASDNHGNTPLHTATFNARGVGDAVVALRNAGADPQRKNVHGISSLALARSITNYNVAQFFADIP